jgi:hypothetical protein
LKRGLVGAASLFSVLSLGVAFFSESSVARLMGSRLGLVFLVVGLVAAGTSSERVRGKVRAYFTEDDSATNLAVARIVVFYLLFRRVWERKAELLLFAGFSPEGFDRSFGTAWWDILPISVSTVEPAAYLLQVSALMAMVGLGTRFFAPLSAVLAYFLFGVSLRYGLVGHGALHPLWFATILAVSPCADALSVDAAWRRFRGSKASQPDRSRAYALPLRFMWLLLGVVYFFPGFWKFWHSGVDWFASNQIVHLMHSIWHRNAAFNPIPGFRLDSYPVLAGLSALGTIVFEIGFFLLMFDRRARVVAAASALLFHRSLGYFIRFGFPYLQAVLVILIDWDKVFRWIGARFRGSETSVPPPEVLKQKPGKVVLLIGGMLLAGNVVAGFAGQESGWPFSSYPTFRQVWKPVDKCLAVRLEGDGESITLRDKELVMRGQTSLLFRLIRHYSFEDTPRTELIERMLLITARRHPRFQGMKRARVSVEEVHADPQRWGEPPVTEAVVLETEFPTEQEAKQTGSGKRSPR